MYHILGQALADGIKQQLRALAGMGRQPDPDRTPLIVPVNSRTAALDQVDLVVDLQNRDLIGIDLSQHRLDLLNVFTAPLVVTVNHVKQQTGLNGLFERRPEGLYQLVGQVADKADRIGQHNRPYIGEIQSAQGRIKGCEQLVRSQNRGCGDAIEKGRFAGVGVTDQRDRGDIRPPTRPTPLITLTPDLVQTLVNRLYPGPQQSAVRFQLCFTGPAQTDTPFLSLKVGPSPDQSGGHMLQLREFNLQLTFMGPGALGENVQYDPGAINHPAFQRPLQVPLLGGTQSVIEQHHVSLGAFDSLTDLIQLAFTDKETGAGLIAGAPHQLNGFNTR
jgi:hypothetical protein